jgi:hypothetical protein
VPEGHGRDDHEDDHEDVLVRFMSALVLGKSAEQESIGGGVGIWCVV